MEVIIWLSCPHCNTDFKTKEEVFTDDRAKAKVEEWLE